MGEEALEDLISIHAPPRGATSTMFPASSPTQFQFTPLREGRQAAVDAEKKALDISIHAPPRGATKAYSPPFPHRIYFNSRPSARGDVHDYGGARAGYAISIHAPPRWATNSPQKGTDVFIFQFTPLREGRRNRQ